MRKKLVTLGVSSLVFMSIVQPFIASTIYNETLYLLLFILAVNAIELFIDKQAIAIPLQIVALYVLVYSYLPTRPQNIIAWVSWFTRYAWDNMAGFINRTNPLIVYEVGMFLVGIVLLVLIKATVKKHRVWYAASVILIYFFILIAFNNVIIRTPLYQLVISTILWRIWILYEYELFKKPFYTLGTCILVGLLFVASVNYQVVYRDIYRTVESYTGAYRVNLSSQGFYRRFQLNRVTGLGAYSGYSIDDSYLGGPLQMNYNTVFRVQQTKPTYWKLENKYNYTGKGWSENGSETIIEYLEGNLYSERNEHVSETHDTSTITYVSGGLPYVPVPFGNVTFDAFSGFESLAMMMSINQLEIVGFSKINLPQPNQTILEGISYSWHEIDATPDELRAVERPENIINSWVSLPRSVSSRVRNLATEITRDELTQYDKVEAIRKYLAENSEFSYGLESVEYTPEGMDFVEHFLFETKVGYCEHYSTAMVVLLRSIGIPARWAKGFSTGVVSNVQEKEYTIRNADAHAWAEVYFEGYGWIPFEATSSFNFDFLNQSTDSTDTPTPGPSNPDGAANPDQGNNPNQNESTENVNPSRPTEGQENVILDFDNLTPTNIIQYGVMLVLVLVAVYFVFKRLILLIHTQWIILKGQSFKKTFVCVLKCIEWEVPRPQHIGVEQYGEAIPPEVQPQYKALVSAYMDIRYGNAPDRKVTSEEKQDFRELLKIIRLKNVFFKK